MSAFGKNFAIEMQGVATELLTQFDGRDDNERMAILKQGDSVWNPTTGEFEIGPDVKYFLTGVAITASADLVDGTTIQAGDKIIKATVKLEDESGGEVDYIPQIKDKVLIDGVQWSVVANPHADYTGNDLIINYNIQVRR